MRRLGAPLLFSLVIGVASGLPCAAQMLETETARLLQHGAGKAGGAFEVQTAPEGRVAPAPCPTIRPGDAGGATGVGDVELTLGQRTDMHFNAGCAFLGNPPGDSLNNVFSGAVAAVHRLGDRMLLFGEVLGSTAASSEAEGEDTVPDGITTIVPEAAGSELMGAEGLGWNITPRVLIFPGGSYDNTSAARLCIGFIFRWGTVPVPAPPAR